MGCCAVTNHTPPEILDHAEKVLIDSNVPEADHRQKLNNAAKVTIWEGVDPQGMREIQGIQAFDRGNHQSCRRQTIVIGPQNFRLLDSSSLQFILTHCFALSTRATNGMATDISLLVFVFTLHRVCIEVNASHESD